MGFASNYNTDYGVLSNVACKGNQRFAVLRTIESIRDYAAKNDGQLPDSLEGKFDLPIPLDPVTGKPFQYSRDGNKARIQCATTPILGGDGFEATYELTIRAKCVL